MGDIVEVPGCVAREIWEILHSEEVGNCDGDGGGMSR